MMMGFCSELFASKDVVKIITRKKKKFIAKSLGYKMGTKKKKTTKNHGNEFIYE